MKALRFVLVVIAVTLVFGIGWRLRHPDWLRSGTQTAATGPAARTAPPATVVQAPTLPDPAAARKLVLSRLSDAPDYEPFFDRLRAAFPTDYTTLIDQTADAVARGSHVPNPDRIMIDAMKRLRQNRGILMAQAEAPQLSGIFTAQAAMLDRLPGDDPALCVDFLYGGMSPTFMAFAARNREAVERLAMASLSAILSGSAAHVERPEPKPEDFDGLTTALQGKGLSDDEIAAVLDGKTFDPPLQDARVCAAGRAYLTALAELPEDARMRVYALSAALSARS